MLHDESTPTTTVDEKEACFIKVTKEGQAIIDVVQYGVDMDVLYIHNWHHMQWHLASYIMYWLLYM